MRQYPEGVWAGVSPRGKVVGLAASIRRGPFVCIGPVAVHPSWEGRGCGRSMISHILDAEADAEGFVLGQSGANPRSFCLYRSFGFRVVGAETVLAGPARGVAATDGVGEGTVDQAVAIDRELSGLDREPDLRMLSHLGRVLTIDDAGYCITVPIGSSVAVGPAAAQDAQTLSALLAAALQDLPSDGAILRTPANGLGFELACGWGLRVERVGTIMVLGDAPRRSGEHLHPVFPEIF